MPQAVRYGLHIHVLGNQKGGGCVPQPMQRDFWQLIPMCFIVSADNLLEYLVGCSYVHLPPIILDEQVIASLPVRPQQLAVFLLLCLVLLEYAHGARR